ncbi:MAG: hypothetical protein ABI658_03500 [Acidimicrobiales bacterium]
MEHRLDEITPHRTDVDQYSRCVRASNALHQLDVLWIEVWVSMNTTFCPKVRHSSDGHLGFRPPVQKAE